MKRKITAITVAILGVILVGCQPMEVDYQFCDDIETIRTELNSVEVTRTAILNEINEDLDELGAERRCPGYSAQQEDNDG